MATKSKAKEAVKSANEYIAKDKNELIESLVLKIKNSKYSTLDEALVGIMHNQVEILELMKSK
tara:strand:+ start:881 stop:1069 length:189 start_codon:yes stop_codon:yes gene_type:complete